MTRPSPWRAVRAIAAREAGAALGTSTGGLLLAGFLGLAGVFWLSMLGQYVAVARDQVFDPYGSLHLNPVDHLVGPWLGNLGVVLLVLCPAVSMRLYAEELRRDSMELLLSAPIGGGVIVVGKFLGAWATVAALVLATAWMPLSLAWWTAVDVGALAAGYGGLLLLAGALVALGGLASSLTDSPLVALVLGFAVGMGLWVAGWVDPDPTSLPSQLSLSVHLQDLLRGWVRLSDVTYFALLAAWALVATHQRVESWRYL